MVMERGKLADMGTHRELLRRCQIYSHLWTQQNRNIA
jgi:ATP-binding cassette subfamily B protein